MTLKQTDVQDEKRVMDTLDLIRKYNFEEVDLVANQKRIRFFYLQSNDQLGVLIAYFNALRLNGSPKKHYNLHCFDVYMTYAKDMKEAIANFYSCEDTHTLKFWLPCFRADKENYAFILDSMCYEQETDPATLEAKYKELRESKRAE